VHGLCGFAHGAAGIGHALLELWRATGEARFHDAGMGAFDYERSWFARGDGSWPDLREIERRAGLDIPAPVSPTWCNGAPGIALSRLRAAQLLESEPVSDDADAALALTRRHESEAVRDDANAALTLTRRHDSEAVRNDADAALTLTRRHVTELSVRAPDDFSLCHGAAGAADVLLYGADTSGLAERIGALGIERHHRTGSRFPGGLRYGATPGLFVGLAGIGLFYLRLSDPTIPTALVIHR
jgi:lantibiotic modifying enzyme